MLEKATLWLDDGEEIRVVVDREDLDSEEFVVRREAASGMAACGNLNAVIGEHLATAKRHAAGTTDRLLEADRQRPY